MTKPTHRVFFDTDLGLGTPRAELDDGAALIALINAPDVELLGITTVTGNLDAVPGMHNTVRLLRAAGGSGHPAGSRSAQTIARRAHLV